MNTIIMNQDVHTPAFIKADASNKSNNIKQQPISFKQVRRFSWTRFIELVILLSNRYRCRLAYLKDSNATGRYRRVSHCRLSDTALYCQSHSPSYLYAAELSLLAGDTLCHPALRALRSTTM